jgi:uncharacterized delta-60 repeat protein
MSNRSTPGVAINADRSLRELDETMGPIQRGSRGRRARAARAAAESLESRVLLSSYTISALASLNSSTSTSAGLISDASGDLFGVSTNGGINNDGSVFEVPAGTSTPQIIATFSGTDGSQPETQLLIDRNGNLYGTTASGGAYGFGNVFMLTNLGGGSYSLSTVADFTGDPGSASAVPVSDSVPQDNGQSPIGPLVLDGNGNLFGLTQNDGTSSGTVFEVVAGTNFATTIASFGSSDYPSGGLVIDNAGDLFGTTLYGGNGMGTVFEMPAGSGILNTLYSFSGTDGQYPGPLTIDSTGNLFGTTYSGGPSGSGTVFEVSSGATLQTLANFDGVSTGNPIGALLLDSSGNLVGTYFNGGDNQDGGVFELAAGSGAVTSLASFSSASGFDPNSGLVENASQGTFFGTTFDGGTDPNNPRGTIFEVAPQVITGPVATIQASPVVSTNVTTETVAVTYTDPAGINTGASSINSGNLQVTDSKGNALTVEQTVTTAGSNPLPSGAYTKVVATYTVDAPRSMWSMSDNGTYNIAVSGVIDSNGDAMQPTMGSFKVSIGTGPAVTITAPPITGFVQYENIKVTFTDPNLIPLLQISNVINDITVTSPKNALLNFSKLALLNAKITPPMGPPTSPVVVTYQIAAPFIADAPTGGWYSGDNGTYTISLAPGSVVDKLGQSNAAFTTTFQVQIQPSPPVGSIATPPEITTSATTPEQVVVTYTGANSVSAASINTGNISVTGPVGNVVAVTSVSSSVTSGNSPSIVATYTVNPPPGGWVNGGYTVTLNTGSAGVQDSLGNFNTKGDTSAFLVNLPVPTPPGTKSSAFNLGFSAQASAVTSSGKSLVVGFEQNATGTGMQGVLEQLTSSGPDTNFGNNAQVIIPGVQLFSVAVAPSGNIIVGGTSNGSLLVGEFTPSGAPAAFGSNGLQVVSGPAKATAFSVAVNPANGDIVAGGTGDGKFLIDELQPGGTQEPGFNGGAPLEFSSGTLGTVKVDSTGNIVGVGAGGASGASVFVARVTSAGTLDPSFGFGTAGIVDASSLFASNLPELTTLSQPGGQLDHTEGLAIDASGKVLVANSITTTRPNGSAGLDFAVVRLNSNGTLDTTWGSNGLAKATFGNNADADVLVLQPDSRQVDGDRVFAVGTTSDQNNYLQTAVAAFTGNGTLDPTFGTNGESTFDPSPENTATGVTSAHVIHPFADGLGGLYFGFASLSTGGVLVAGSNAGSTAGRSTVRTLVVATPLLQGTLVLSVSSTLPAKVIEGMRANQKVRVTVTNSSSSVVSLSSLQFFVNTFQSTTGATPISIPFGKPVSLKPRAHKVLTLKLGTYPTVPAAGNYYLIAAGTASDNSVTQVASSLTTNIAPPTFTGSIPNLTPLAGSVARNKFATIALTLTNSGNEPLTGSATLTITGKLGAQTVPITTAVLRGVKQKISSSKVYRVKFKVPASLAAGAYTLSVSLSGLGLKSPITATAAAPLNVT